MEWRTTLESDEFFADFIIDGFSFLTMDDVFCITYKNFDQIERIDNQNVIHEIFKEFKLFTKPLIKRGLTKKMLT